MDDPVGRLVSLIIGSIVSPLIVQRFSARPQLVYWFPGETWFQLKELAATAPVPQQTGSTTLAGEGNSTTLAPTLAASQTPAGPHLLVSSVTIQNFGRKEATGIEIAHRTRPDHFKLEPSLNYTEATTPDGVHIVRVETLGTSEWFTFQIVSYATIPDFLYIRSNQGHAKRIPITLQRVYPRWVLYISAILVTIGAAATLYGLYRVGVWASTHWPKN